MANRSTVEPKDRHELQQVIANLIQGVLLIDLDGAIAWANDAALALHGCTGIAELGGSAAGYRRRFALHYRNHHALHAKQYPLARLAAGEHFDGVTVELTHRAGGDFHRVLELRGFPVISGLQIIETLVLVIKDVTERTSADDRFERAFAANPAPAVILRLADSRYVKANQGFLEMTGLAADAVVGLPFHEFDVLREAEHREAALAAVHEHRTVPQQEAALRLRSGADKFVIVAGQPIELAGSACILFTFDDLDTRKLAEASLRQSEEQFAKAFQLAPVPLLICTLDGWRVLAANDAFGAVTGYRHPDIHGQSVGDIGFWKGTRILQELDGPLGAGHEVRALEVPLLTRSGARLDCLLSAEPVTLRGRACALCVVEDITERKRTEADMVHAIEAVMKDTSWFSHTVMEKLAQLRAPRGATGELAELTPREREILGLICRGQGDPEIAAALHLSRNTVRNHVANLYSKIGVKRRSAAVVWGRERGVGSY